MTILLAIFSASLSFANLYPISFLSGEFIPPKRIFSLLISIVSPSIILAFPLEIFFSELSQFAKEAKCTCSLTDVWSVKYQKGDHQTVHNHRGWGFSGVLYVEFDPKVHTPTCFMAPWQDPREDTTMLSSPRDVKEGTIFIAPSFTHHFVHANQSRKQRTVVAFDLLPDLPEHQSLNKNV